MPARSDPRAPARSRRSAVRRRLDLPAVEQHVCARRRRGRRARRVQQARLADAARPVMKATSTRRSPAAAAARSRSSSRLAPDEIPLRRPIRRSRRDRARRRGMSKRARARVHRRPRPPRDRSHPPARRCHPVTAARRGYARPTGMPAPDALQQPIELDLFEGPFDLLLTLVLRDEVELLDLPLVEVVTASLGERARERWDTDTAGELIVLLAAMAELKARRLLGEPGRGGARSRHARGARGASPRGSSPTRRSSAPRRWLAERARDSAGPRYRRVPLEGAAPPPPPVEDPPRACAEAMRPAHRRPPRRRSAHLTNRRVSMPAALARLQAALAPGPLGQLRRPHATAWSRWRRRSPLMAALELARRGEVTLAQAEPFGDIAITRVARERRASSPARWRRCCSCRPSRCRWSRSARSPRSRPGDVQRALAELAERHGPEGGLEVAEIAGGFTLRTRADLAEVVRPPPRAPARRPRLARPPSRRWRWSPTSSRSAARRSAGCAGVAVELDGHLAGGARAAGGGGPSRRRRRHALPHHARSSRSASACAGRATCRRSSGSSSAAPRPSGCGCSSSRRGTSPRTADPARATAGRRMSG